MVKGLHTMLTEMALMMPTFGRKSLLATEQTSPCVSVAAYEIRPSMGRKAEPQEERMTTNANPTKQITLVVVSAQSRSAGRAILVQFLSL